MLPFTVFEEQCLVQIFYKLSEKLKNEKSRKSKK